MKIYTKQKQQHWLGIWLMVILSVWSMQVTFAQNSLIGDGFGGNAGYTPTNYSVACQTAYAICGDTLKSWGENGFYQLGNGNRNGIIAPWYAVFPNAKYVSGGFKTAAIKTDNTLWVWGTSLAPDYGALATSPTQVATNVKFVHGGASHVSFVKNDGTAWVVGHDGLHSSNIIPGQVPGISNCVRVASGGMSIPSSNDTFTGYLMNDGTVKYTASPAAGGDPTLTPALTPTSIPSLTNVVDIKANFAVLYALKSDGTVWAMGNNYYGGFGNGTTTNSFGTPVQVLFPSGVSIKAISSCGHTTLALSTTGDVYAWGLNDWGQLGTGNFTTALTPVVVTTNAKDIMAGQIFAYVVKNDGTFWVTGASGAGDIFFGVYIQRLVYTQRFPTAAPYNLCAATDAFGCNAGTTAPTLSATTKSNTCPATTVDLTTLTASNTPATTSLTWHTGIPATTANKIATPAAITTAGTYYAAFFDAGNDCYSTATTMVTASITGCTTCNAGSTAPTLSSTTKSNTCPATTVDLTTITASNLPANTNLTWHSGTPATTANKVANPATITTAGTYYAAFFDATNACYSTATTAVTATVNGCSSCNAGSSAPSLIKN